MASLTLDSQDGVIRSMRGSPPTHYIVKIQSFSLLIKNAIEKYESGDFEVGGYKWKLVLYPNGNKSKNVREHISLYLAMADTSSLRSCWELYAVLRLFLLDQNTDSYLVLQDALGKDRRFHGLKLECGFDQFIPLKTFHDAANGYLVDDTCVIGAEVLVRQEIRSKGKGECISMIKDPITSKHVWKIENFSKLDSEYHDSKLFIAGDKKWKIVVYPKGKGHGMGSYLSLYLALADPATLPAGSKILAEFTLRLMDQVHGKHDWDKATYCFSASDPESGFPKLVSLPSFYSPSYGVLVKDTCIVEAEVTVHGIANAL